VGGRRCNMNEERKKALTSLKTCKGQIEGIIKMIEDGRYCVDVSNQIIAAQALLKKANMLILKQHLHHCVKEAVIHDKGDEKIDEIIDILEKVMQK
jgi:CsoR family transcriptional regulator, copper-sensing transcriptional repressor